MNLLQNIIEILKSVSMGLFIVLCGVALLFIWADIEYCIKEYAINKHTYKIKISVVNNSNNTIFIYFTPLFHKSITPYYSRIDQVAFERMDNYDPDLRYRADHIFRVNRRTLEISEVILDKPAY